MDRSQHLEDVEGDGCRLSRAAAEEQTVHQAIKPGRRALEAWSAAEVDARRVDGLVAAAAGYATVLVRGGLPEGTENSAYYRPSLIEVSDVDMPIVQHEVFGPVATFEVFDTEADAVRRANATEYGLAASVWSRDIDRPLRVGRELRAGTVWTNTWAVVVDQFEEGGFGQSGLGRLNGLRGLAEFQEDKTYAQNIGGTQS